MVKIEFVIDLALSPERKLALEDSGKFIKSLKEQVFCAIATSKRDTLNIVPCHYSDRRFKPLVK
ncbi:MAG: hypothetical protein MUF15_28405 [Acidobacteria bacterium]|jgi:uncharacterized protein YcgL (UPF0745 family)|nr:hypothetical protein [Acidobacteriota bacterium]